MPITDDIIDDKIAVIMKININLDYCFEQSSFSLVSSLNFGSKHKT